MSLVVAAVVRRENAPPRLGRCGGGAARSPQPENRRRQCAAKGRPVESPAFDGPGGERNGRS
eukprot:9617830-Prorocentrum_lima.AAC.1